MASLFGALPIGMFGLGILLLARDATGSFADAGLVVGAFGLLNSLGAVAQGRLMDRIGQGPVLRTAATVHLPAQDGKKPPNWSLIDRNKKRRQIGAFFIGFNI